MPGPSRPSAFGPGPPGDPVLGGQGESLSPDRADPWEDDSTVAGRRGRRAPDDSGQVLHSRRIDEATRAGDYGTPRPSFNDRFDSNVVADSAVEELTIEESAAVLNQPLLLRAVEAAAEAEDPHSRQARVLVVAGNDDGRRFQLTGDIITIGRGMDNDIVLTDLAVSRRHLRIEFDGSCHYMQDLGSGNGTLLNGRDEDGRALLRHGDRVEIGNTTLRFESPRAAEASPTENTTDAEQLTRQRDRVDEHAPKFRRTVGAPVPPAPRLPEFDDDDRDTPVAANHPLDDDARTIAGKKPRPRVNVDSIGATPSPDTNAPTAAVLPPRRHVSTTAPPPAHGGAPDYAAPGQFQGTGPSGSLQTLGAQSAPQAYAPQGAPPAGGPAPEYPQAPPNFGNMNAVTAMRPRSQTQFPRALPHLQPTREKRGGWLWIALLVVVLLGGGSAAAFFVYGGSSEPESVASDDQDAEKNPTSDTPAAEEDTPDVDDGAKDDGAKEDGANDADTATASTETAEDGGSDSANGDGDGTTEDGDRDKTGEPATVADNSADSDSTATDGADQGKDEAANQAKDEADDKDRRIALLSGTRKPQDLRDDTWGTDEGGLTDATNTVGQGKDDDKDAGKDEKSNDRNTEGRDNDRPLVREDANEGEKDERKLERLARDARAQADSRYRQRDFSGAAAIARRASGRLDGNLARRMKATAKRFERLGAAMSGGNRALEAGNNRSALRNYAAARSLDRQLGGAHKNYINARIRVVAPTAAREYMADGNYTQAKRAADYFPERAGGVYKALEAAAKKRLQAARRLSKEGASGRREAISLAKQAKAIVRPSSPIRKEADALLRSLGG